MTSSEILSGHSHSFDTGIAKTLGINAAIVYNHIAYWIKINSNKKDAELIEGKYWMYETQKQMADFLEYMTLEEVKKAVVKLLDAGLLIKGNFNKNPFDRTTWYALGDVKKQLTIAPYGAMEDMDSAPSESAVRRHVYIHNKQQEEHQDKKPAAAGADEIKNFSPLIYKNTKGEATQVSESDVYAYFLKLPYSTQEIQEAISQVKVSNDFIGNVFKYLEAICLRIHNSKSSKVKEVTKKQECDIPDTSNQPKVNFGEYMKKHHGMQLGKKNEAK